MRITSLKAENFLCHRLAELQFSSNGVDLIAGHNGAGKTSILEAIRLLLLGNSRAGLKKLWPSLVMEGHKKGALALSYREQDAEQDLTVKLPSGTRTGQSVENPALPFVLGASSLITLKPQDLRILLFSLAGITSEYSVLDERLVALGFPEAQRRVVLNKFRAGSFELAETEVKSMVREKRAAWEQCTGEKYGSAKADDWSPTQDVVVTDPDRSELDAAQSAFHSAQAALEHAVAEQAKANASHALSPAERETLQAQAGDVENLEARLRALQQDLQHAQSTLQDLAKEGKGLAQESLTCPQCKTSLSLVDGKLAHGLAPELRAQLLQQSRDSYRTTRDQSLALETRIKDVEARFFSAKEAAHTLQNQNAQSAHAAGMLQDLDNQVLEARQKLEQARQRLGALQESFRAAREYKVVTDKAASLHADILLIQQVATLLSPNGLQAELTRPVFDRFNALLQEVSELSGWLPMQVTDDCVPTYAGRPLFLLSESEQWRVETSMTYALAVLSGLNLCLFDRVDVLDVVSRAQMFRFAHHAAKTRDVQFILAATLKEKPQFPFPVTWIEKKSPSDFEQVA